MTDHRGVTLQAVKQRYSNDAFHRVGTLPVSPARFPNLSPALFPNGVQQD